MFDPLFFFNGMIIQTGTPEEDNKSASKKVD
jgi:hypothetical protein